MKIHRILGASLALSVLVITGAFAQATTATLRGKVVDSEGTGLPGVPVTVASKSHGDAKKTVMTDIEGDFKFQLLPPANDYTLTVNYPGFAPIEVGPIDLDPGKTTVQDITLRSQEELTQRVEVVAHGSVVDTESTKTSTTFNTEFIEGLPIIGRNYQDILTLTPGVTDTDGDGNPNVQGARATGLQYRLDGGNITDPFSGTFGQNLNLDAVEEIEVITSGASAEYGRADGGFTNVITKSGGNDFEGNFKMFWRGRILDGDGATENNDTIFTVNRIERDLRRIDPYVTIGGALKKDKLWYFASLQYTDRALPISLAGSSFTRTFVGTYSFAKLTWQVNSDNKVALQFNSDPAELHGQFLDFGIELDSDATWNQGSRVPQLRWTSIVSPTLLMETLLTSYTGGIAIDPVSDLFHPTNVTTTVVPRGNVDTIQAFYPTGECSVDGTFQGFVRNCDASLFNPSIYQIDLITGAVTGPYPGKSDDTRKRNSIKTDLTYTIEDAWGEHQIKSGLEFADEKFEDQPINNPFFSNLYERCPNCTDSNNQPVRDAVQGVQILTVADPLILDQRAVSFNSGAYITDTWKPKQNITLTAGLRLDQEDVDTTGFEPFNPRDQKGKFNEIVEALCFEANRSRMAGDPISNWSLRCDPASGFKPGQNPGDLEFTYLPDAPESVRKFDRDEDGIFDETTDGSVWTEPLSTFNDREPQNFQIKNLNLSPRFSVSWDPWADGKTKLYGTWGRYFDRLYLQTVLGEMGPDTLNFIFVPDADQHAFLANSLSLSSSAVSVTQVSRDLETPFTDTFTMGFERELAPEWSAKVTYTQKLGWNLLQDVDLNHILCTEHDDVFDIDPASVCTLYTKVVNGKNKPVLSDDLFGDVTAGFRRPNTAPDLYLINPNFNQVLRVGNYNASKYRSIAMEVNKRLHRNWQMQASYTYSRALGNAEDFLSGLGNDPATSDDEKGYLNYDQRHRVVFFANTHLPKDVELGGTITWEGGTPYSIIKQTADLDDNGNVILRRFFPTHQRNDQRNGNFWGIDTQVVKRFQMGNVQASAQVAVQNILNMDDLTLSAYRKSSFNGVQLAAGPQGLRRFGRIWELGMTFNF